MNGTEEWKNNGVINKRRDGWGNNSAIYRSQGSHLIFNTFPLENKQWALTPVSKQFHRDVCEHAKTHGKYGKRSLSGILKILWETSLFQSTQRKDDG